MNKQEEIREGIRKLIGKWEDDSPDAGYGYEADRWIPELLTYLHEEGVVLLIDGNEDVAQVEPLMDEYARKDKG